MSNIINYFAPRESTTDIFNQISTDLQKKDYSRLMDLFLKVQTIFELRERFQINCGIYPEKIKYMISKIQKPEENIKEIEAFVNNCIANPPDLLNAGAMDY